MRKTLIKVYKNDHLVKLSSLNKERAVCQCSKSYPEKFQETHRYGLLCRSIFSKKVGVSQPGALLKTRFQRRYFDVSFARFFKTAFVPIVPTQFYVQ